VRKAFSAKSYMNLMAIRDLRVGSAFPKIRT
jgi:hypothetical protein